MLLNLKMKVIIGIKWQKMKLIKENNILEILILLLKFLIQDMLKINIFRILLFSFNM